MKIRDYVLSFENQRMIIVFMGQEIMFQYFNQNVLIFSSKVKKCWLDYLSRVCGTGEKTN